MTFGGGYSHIFNLDSALEAAPAIQIIVAPIARLAFGLSFPYPSAVLYPTAFWVAGPLFLSAMALPICAGDRWLDTWGSPTPTAAHRLGSPGRHVAGHRAGRASGGPDRPGGDALRTDRRPAGTVPSRGVVARGGPGLSVPGLPGCSHGSRSSEEKEIEGNQWFEAIVPMILLPLLVLAVPLATEASATVRQLIHQKVYDIAGFITPTWNLDPGVAAFIRALVALAAIPAVFLVVRSLRRADIDLANVVVWTLGLLFGLRVFEPELVPYFLCPALALLAISAARAPWWRFIATCVLALWVNWWLKIPIQARWLEWLVL